ncbi:MAG: NAD(P)-binding domain-containing protein, partial [Burkholderiaceae bacterium]
MSRNKMASSVAVLGVGSMGLPLVHRLVTAGFRVLAYDADVKALERLPDAVQRVSTPREAAGSARTVIGCLPSLQAYRQTVLGRQGVVHG